MTGPACAGGCVPFYPGPMLRAVPARRVRRANAGQVLPVPGGRLDERTAGRHVCHNCVMFCVMFCVIIVSIMNKSLIFRQGYRPTAKRPKMARLDFYVIYIT